jgi:hypothetical protein
MHGFQPQNRFGLPLPTISRWTQVPLRRGIFCVVLSLMSGCAMTQNAWKSVHSATCGEHGSKCHCSCAECSSEMHMAKHGAETVGGDAPLPATSPSYPVTPVPPEGSRPVEHAVQPQAATMNGMPGTWIPAPHTSTPGEFEAPSAVPVPTPGAVWQGTEYYTSNNPPTLHIPPRQGQAAIPQPSAMCPPDAGPQQDALSEYRNQVQVLSEQISRMMTSQESIKASQETLKESHAREILELKLQQATAERDRLQRERELELELEKQRQRELETIDSLSQIVEGVMPRNVPGAAAAPAMAPRSATQARQLNANAPQQLPAVDENL